MSQRGGEEGGKVGKAGKVGREVGKRMTKKPGKRVQEEVDAVCGDRKPSIEDMMNLKFTTRVINESMRLYPQPPVLIRRALEDVELVRISHPPHAAE